MPRYLIERTFDEGAAALTQATRADFAALIAANAITQRYPGSNLIWLEASPDASVEAGIAMGRRIGALAAERFFSD